VTKKNYIPIRTPQKLGHLRSVQKEFGDYVRGLKNHITA